MPLFGGSKETRRTIDPRDLLAAVVAVEPGCRGRNLGGKLAVKGRSQIKPCVGGLRTALKTAVSGLMPTSAR